MDKRRYRASELYNYKNQKGLLEISRGAFYQNLANGSIPKPDITIGMSRFWSDKLVNKILSSDVEHKHDVSSIRAISIELPVKSVDALNNLIQRSTFDTWRDLVQGGDEYAAYELRAAMIALNDAIQSEVES